MSSSAFYSGFYRTELSHSYRRRQAAPQSPDRPLLMNSVSVDNPAWGNAIRFHLAEEIPIDETVARYNLLLRSRRQLPGYLVRQLRATSCCGCGAFECILWARSLTYFARSAILFSRIVVLLRPHHCAWDAAEIVRSISWSVLPWFHISSTRFT